MTNKEWRWSDKKPSMFRKALTLAHSYTEPVVKILELPIDLLPFGESVRGAIKKGLELGTLLPQASKSDLEISTLSDANGLSSLEGRKILSTDDEKHPVFLDGFCASFTLSHNGKGKDPILLERLELVRLNYEPGENPRYEIPVSGEAQIGAGIIEPHRFMVGFGKTGISPAIRSGTSARSDNFFDMDPEVYLTFKPAESQELIKVAGRALDPGMYSLRFDFYYRVRSRELRCRSSLPIRVYSNGIA